MQSWQQTEDTLTKGPRSAGWLIFKWLLILIVALTVLGIFGRFVGWFGQAAQVASEQFGPREMLRKYEWFKDAAAQLDGLKATILTYDGRQARIEDAYRGMPRASIPRDDRAELDQIAAEVAGTKAAYNQLAAQYNAQMAKFNYRFANAGMLPEGATQLLQREYRSYEEK